MRVLVIEDETVLADAVATGLRRESLAVDVSYDGSEGLRRALYNDYDVVVVDRDLPGLHGDEVCVQIIAAGRAARLLMLTASADISSRVAGLSLGADDYLSKPFAFAELVARVRALGRRTPQAVPPVLTRAGVQLDPGNRTVRRDGLSVSPTRKEFAVLEELLRANGNVVSAEHLLEKAWDENVDPFTNVVRTTVMNLRKKLGEPPLIHTVTGVGYRL